MTCADFLDAQGPKGPVFSMQMPATKPKAPSPDEGVQDNPLQDGPDGE